MPFDILSKATAREDRLMRMVTITLPGQRVLKKVLRSFTAITGLSGTKP